MCGLSIFQGWGLAWAGAPSRCKIIRHDNRLIAAHIKNSSCLQMVILGGHMGCPHQTKTLNLGKRTGRCGRWGRAMRCPPGVL